MIEFHPQVKAVHVAAVVLSGALFFARGLLVNIGRPRWAMSAPVRFSSYGIDTVLLVSALMLVAMLSPALFANQWLSVKLALVVVYIALGVIALKPRFPTAARQVSFAAAVVVFLAIVGIARAHHPMGWLLGLR